MATRTIPTQDMVAVGTAKLMWPNMMTTPPYKVARQAPITRSARKPPTTPSR